MTGDIRPTNGGTVDVSGFYTINEDVLRKLKGEHLELLNERGYLEAIYMAIASMTNIPALLEKKNQQRKVDPEHRLPSSGNPGGPRATQGQERNANRVWLSLCTGSGHALGPLPVA